MSSAVRLRFSLCVVWSSVLAATFITSGSASADKDKRALANLARGILNSRCFQCHGANGVARKNIFVLDRSRLISSKTVIAGDKDSLLLKVVETGAMPLGGPALAEDEKAILRKWVLDGAEEWDGDERLTPAQPFIAEPAITAMIRDDLTRARERGRGYLRYFSIAHLYNARVPAEELDTYRAALSKLVNSLSWHPQITQPAPIDPARTIFRIDLRDYNWTAATWDALVAAYPYGVRVTDAEAITRMSGAATPYIRADWFVANASAPPLYSDILALPRTVQQLEKQLGVDASRNIEEEKNVARAGIRTSGVSQNNRILERHVSAHGAYWKSADFRSNLDDQNIFKDPISLKPAGGEIIFNLPNGMQAYFLADGRGNRIDQATINIVADRNNPDSPIIQNGRSCISCHYGGIQSFKDDVRDVVRAMSLWSFDRDKALALYPVQESWDRLIEKDRARFQLALDQAGARTASGANNEPINALVRKFSSELSVAEAAAEAGMEVKEFQARVNSSARLAALGYGQLLVPNGGFKRDAWEKNFSELARELGLGDFLAGGNLIRSSRAAATGQILSVDDASARIARSAITSTDPAEIMRAARTIYIMSGTMFLGPTVVADELSKRPEFKALGLVIVTDRRRADLQVNLGRPLFTYTFTFSVTNPETSIVVTSGKVTAFDGNFAAPKIAKAILKQLVAARSTPR